MGAINELFSKDLMPVNLGMDMFREDLEAQGTTCSSGEVESTGRRRPQAYGGTLENRRQRGGRQG